MGLRQILSNATRNPLHQPSTYCKVILPIRSFLLLESAILFPYLVDNPPIEDVPATHLWCCCPEHVSVGLVVLFLAFARLMFSLAMGTGLIVIDWLSIRVRGTPKVFGPGITQIVQSSSGHS
jgi:hypothetical protein